MLNHLKSHALSYGLAAVVVIFFTGQALIWSWPHETNPFEPQAVEAAFDIGSAEKIMGLEQKNYQLYTQNEQLSSQNEQLYTKNQQLNGQNQKLNSQNEQLSAKNDQLHKENTQLYQQITQLHEVIKEKEELAASQTRELGLRHQQLASYEQAFEAMNAPSKTVKQAVMKQTETDAGLVKLAKETLGVDVEVRDCR